jgi:hypothetical protein
VGLKKKQKFRLVLNKYCPDKDAQITVFLYCPEMPPGIVVRRVYSNQTIGRHTHRFARISPKAVFDILTARK